MSVDLARIYASLDASAAGGVDPARLRQETASLRRGDGGATASAFDEPFGSIRLVAAPVRLEPDTLAVVLDARHRVLHCCFTTVPFAAVFQTPPSQLHFTIWHFGRPGDPRPLEPAAIATEAAELSSNVLAAFPPFQLTIDRLLLSDSGVLLLLYQTADDAPLKLRELLRKAFPASPAKQTVILHSSLARLLDVPTAEEVACIREVCAAATAALKGRAVQISSVFYVVERALPIDGDVTELPLGGAPA
jgi:hypothetical protein